MSKCTTQEPLEASHAVKSEVDAMDQPRVSTVRAKRVLVGITKRLATGQSKSPLVSRKILISRRSPNQMAPMERTTRRRPCTGSQRGETSKRIEMTRGSIATSSRRRRQGNEHRLKKAIQSLQQRKQPKEEDDVSRETICTKRCGWEQRPQRRMLMLFCWRLIHKQKLLSYFNITSQI